MQFDRGVRLGSYEIAGAIGAGGMGEVYRARDLRIGREVAVKVISADLATDPEHVRRFRQEAQAAASLNHPNHVALFDIGEHEGRPYLVYELLEGRTLREVIQEGRPSLKNVLSWGAQIARGLAAAHEAGIVHRDLKPENLFVGVDDRVRILDFGLAKLCKQPNLGSAPDDATQALATTPGVVLGTVGYMAPEQIRGEPSDAGADVFSLGVVLWEMVCGSRPFRGRTQLDVLTAILNADPAGGEESGVPAALQAVMLRCLEKSPRRRYQSADDLAFHLETISTVSGVAQPPVGISSRRPGVSWFRPVAALGLLAAGLVIGVAWRAHYDHSDTIASPPFFSAVTLSGSDRLQSVSDDGSLVVYVSSRGGREGLWTMTLPRGDEAPIEGIDGSFPDVSPDKSTVLYSSEGNVLAVPMLGGRPRLLVEGAEYAKWSPSGKTLAFVRVEAEVSRLMVANVDGSGERELHRSTTRLHLFGGFSPDGRKLAAALGSPGNSQGRGQFIVVDIETGETTAIDALPPGGTLFGVDWRTDDELIYSQPASKSPLNQEFRLVSHSIGAGSARVAARLDQFLSSLDTVPDGRVFVSARRARSNVYEVPLSEDGSPRRLTAANAFERQPTFSPDGRWIAFSTTIAGNCDLWAVARDTGERRRLTDDPGTDFDPGYLSDGSLLWSSDRTGTFEIWISSGDGRNPRMISSDGLNAENPTSTSDGTVFYSSSNPEKIGLWRIAADRSAARRLREGRSSIPEVSPTGEFVSFLKVKSPALAEVWVIDADGGDEHFVAEATLVGTSTALLPGRSRWARDGRAILYITATGSGMGIVRQDLDSAAEPVGSPRAVFVPPEGMVVESFDVSTDGQTLAIALLESEDTVLVAENIAFARR